MRIVILEVAMVVVAGRIGYWVATPASDHLASAFVPVAAVLNTC